VTERGSLARSATALVTVIGEGTTAPVLAAARILALLKASRSACDRPRSGVPAVRSRLPTHLT
jgi:hypothetical protein